MTVRPSPLRRAHRRWRRVVAAALLTAAVVALQPATASASPLGDRIIAILKSNGLAHAGTGVSVTRIGASSAAFAYNSPTRLAPASNMKLVTAAGALRRWGPDHRFKTELYLSSTPSQPTGVLWGSVFLKGYGDPSLSTTSYQRDRLHISTASISSFVTRLKGMGVTPGRWATSWVTPPGSTGSRP